MKRIFGSRKAVSPVIATIIIVAIAIVMSIAVAYWVLGLGASFTKYEKLQFISAYAASNTNGTYTIHMTLKNTGTATATIDPATIFYNGKPGNAYPLTDVPVTNFPLTPYDPGKGSGDLTILLPNAGGTWTSGMSVEVMIQTTSGSQYPKVIVLQ